MPMMPAMDAASLERSGGALRSMIQTGELCTLPPWVAANVQTRRAWTVGALVIGLFIFVLLIAAVALCLRGRTRTS